MKHRKLHTLHRPAILHNGHSMDALVVQRYREKGRAAAVIAMEPQWSTAAAKIDNWLDRRLGSKTLAAP